MLGEDHPDTITARANLAVSYSSAGQLDKAITLEEQVLADSVRVLGEDHPDTITARANLAVGLWQTGEHEQAIGQMATAVDHAEQALSENHPLRNQLTELLRQMREALAE